VIYSAFIEGKLGIGVRIVVAIATVGRPSLLRQTVAQLEHQSRLPDKVLVSTVTPEDAGGVSSGLVDVEIILGEKGLCRQRNAALASVQDNADLIIFFDDDFVANDCYLEEVEKLFLQNSDLVGATGRIIADGINGPGYGFDEAIDLLRADRPMMDTPERETDTLYGCNMVIKSAAASGMMFDERLPLYGWLEDIDFTYRLGQRGRLCASERFAGVHMGSKGGRNSGVRLGYSQIANPVYLLRKRSAPPKLAYRLMARNLISNVVRSMRPEPWVDRPGRLRGNLKALSDLLRGRIDPRRVIAFD
jgi:GT2 family glycosyltransferase